MGNLWIIKDGLAVPEDDLLSWAHWYESERGQYSLLDTIAGIRVSTVFLGMDHNFGKGEPILWETMIFNDDEKSTVNVMGRSHTFAPDLGQWRFSFDIDAYDFHDKKVAELKALFAGNTIKEKGLE